MKKFTLIILAVAVVFAFCVNTGAVSFIDVPEDAYYAEAAERMNEKGILTGYGDNRYNGNDNITRAQMAVVAVRLLGKEPEAKTFMGKTMFSDFTPALDWATGYVNYASAAKIINGDGDGTYRPNDSVKYEEVVKIIVCVLGLDENVKIDPADWSKEYLEAADKAGLLEGLVGKKGEPMKRSDIAVICDASISFLEGDDEKTEEPEATENEVTTAKSEKPVTTKKDKEEKDEPKVTTKVTTKATTEKEEPEETTAVVTTEEEEPEETTAVITTEEEEEPEETTTETTTRKTPEIVTYPPIITSYSPPPPLEENELPEL